jgi:hypothetical protein
VDKTRRLYFTVVGVLIACICLVAAVALTGPRLGLVPVQSLPAGEALPASPEPTVEKSPVPTYTPTAESAPPVPVTEPAPAYQLRDAPLAGPDCDWTGFFGTVWDATGQPQAGVQIGIWDENDNLIAISISGPDGKYERQISEKPLAGTWALRVLVDGGPASDSYAFRSDEDCRSGQQRFQIDWEQKPR